MAGTDLQGTGRKKMRGQIMLIILAMSLLKLLIHLLVVGNYELYRDAYLYISYADNPQWGYIKNPPFMMVISWFATKVLGGSVFALRFFPALAGAVSMYLIGSLVKELGGKKWAVIIACVSFLVAPIFLRSNSLFQVLAFDQLFWFLYLFFFVRLLQTYNKNYWFVLGLVAGVGFLTQYTIVVPVALTTLFLIATRHRKLLWVPQFWGFLINVAILIIPNLIWQYNHNWPELENLKVIRENQLLTSDRGWFLGMQFLMLAPAVLVWVAGIYNLFVNKASRPYIVLGYSFVGVVLLMLLLQGKAYYTAPFYMILLVFGAIQWESWLEDKYKWALGVLTAFLIAVTIPMFPLSLPYLNMDRMIWYKQAMVDAGFESPFVWDDGLVHDLPEDYANMTGWRELSTLVNNTFSSLTTEEQKSCAIYAEDYAYAGAINYYNRKNKNFPKAFCFDGSIKFWTPKSAEGIHTIIYIGKPNALLLDNFENAENAAFVTDEHFKETGLPITVFKNAKPSFISAYLEYREVSIKKNHRKPFEHNK